jgi:Type I phosphodiesterase / nucleotide pyrophosphatase
VTLLGSGNSLLLRRASGVLAALLAIASAVGCATPAKVAEFVAQGDNRLLRRRDPGTPPSSPDKPAVLFLAIDGVDRALLYDMLRKGELPMLAKLLGSEHDQAFLHAYFDDDLLSTLPSSTMAAWATAMTGVTPAHHGVTGNEFFMREVRRLAAPAPASFSDAKATVSIYTDEYMNVLNRAPSVYERMRAQDPNVLVWVAVHPIFAGADRLLVAKPTILAQAFEQVIEDAAREAAVKKKNLRLPYQRLDEDVMQVVVDALGTGPVPDVLTVYLPGTDLFAHIAEEGPDAARRSYLREVVEPAVAHLNDRLRVRGALANRYVVVTSDHGHTEVLSDDEHALSSSGNLGPPELLRRAGFRVRPFKLDVTDRDDFDAVLAYGGATAFAYVADRSTCQKAKDVCDWSKPPRYEEDVVPLAEAFYKNNHDGALLPHMKGTLDLVLTRRPKPHAETDLPFEVYVGGGKTVPVGEYLKEHPHPTYIAVEARLRDLAVGPYGERAGDVMLLAHNGDRETPDERFYFAARYRSWHGSPSRRDSEIPLIVAHPGQTSAVLRARVQRVLGAEPRQEKITDLLLDLRSDAR